MNKYIAFLRGINVGGNNKISMSELKDVFESLGYKNIISYINSGNIIFSTTKTDISELRKTCEKAIALAFSLDIKVSIISEDDLKTTLENAPGWWDNDRESKHNAIFVIEPFTAKEVTEEIDEKKEYEKVAYHNNVIFWSAPLKTFSKTKWAKIASTKVYSNITIRNANTVKKIVTILN